MDSQPVGGDVVEAMCKQNSKGEEKGKVGQQASGNRFRIVRGQPSGKKPPRVAKYNVYGYDSLGVKWLGYGCSTQTTPNLVYRCWSLGVDG